MGGAEETALTPQREYSEEETVASPKKSKELLANDDVGTPVDLPGEASDEDDEGEEESDAVAEEMNPAAEEEEGWGSGIGMMPKIRSVMTWKLRP